MFKKKAKNIEVVGKQEGERQKNINEPKYKIQVYKHLGREVPQEIDSFYATQKKDSSGSMFLVNEDHNFKEPLSISKNDSVEKLKYRLDLKKLPLEKQKEILDQKIDSQEKLVRSIENGVIEVNGETKKVNSIEEEKRLKQLKVLRYIINHSETGSYDAIDGEGFRQRFYLYNEGALIPMFWDRNTASLYVAVDTAIKFYKADQDLIEQDYLDENRSKWANFGRGLAMVIMVIVFLAFMYGIIQNNDRSNELDARASAMAEAIENSNFGECIATISTTNEELLKIIEEYRETNETNINTVNTDLS
jgi:hypothetical protein